MTKKFLKSIADVLYKLQFKKFKDQIYPNDYKKKIYSNILYFDRIYNIVTNDNIDDNIDNRKYSQSEFLVLYFKHYSEKIKMQISKDLNLKKETVHINSIKNLDNHQICVSFEVVIISSKNHLDILDDMKFKEFTADLIVKKFLKSHLNCKYAMIHGKTVNISCIQIDIKRLHLFI